MLKSQKRRKGLDLSVTVSQSGKMRIDGDVSSTRRLRTVSSIAEVKFIVAPFLRRNVIGGN